MIKLFPKPKTVYILCSFMAGFSLMTVEIISSRIMAPIIGSSIYTWASVIGMTLLGLAIGSALGGELADKYNNTKILPTIFLISGISTLLISPLSRHTDWIVNSSNSIILINILISGYLFLIPAIILGLIQPIILKKYADDFTKIGSNYGFLSTTWSLGSILGVFVTGFYFVSTLGSQKTLYIIGFILLLISLLLAFLNKERKILYLAGIILIISLSLALLPSSPGPQNIVYDQESSYYRMRVVDFNQEPFGKSRALVLDFDTHSIETEKILETKYTEVYPVFGYLMPKIKDILVIGGGAYTLPKLLKGHYSTSNVSVMEIDPKIKEVATNFFDLDQNSIKTIEGDARFLIKKGTAKYDLIYSDAYSSFISVPGQLLTKEYNEEIRKTLNPDGIYALNFIGSLVGDNSALFKSITNTFKQTFPNYYILAFGNTPLQTQSVTLIGLKGDKKLTESTLKNKILLGKNSFLAQKVTMMPELYLDKNALILTDDFYPTERLMASTINEYFPRFLAFIKTVL